MWSVTYLQIKLLWCILDIFVILKALVKIAWNRWDLLFLNCGWLLSYETEQNHTRWQTVKSNKKSWNTFGQRYVTSSSWIVLLNPTPTNLQRSIPVFSSINVSTNRLPVPFTVNSDVKISVLKLSEAFNTIKQDHGLDKISGDRAYASHLLLLRRSFSKQAGGGHWEFLLCPNQEHCTAASVIVRSSLTLWYAKQHVRKCPTDTNVN